DIGPWFAQDWNTRHEPFEFPDDYHWNRHGHEVAARALKELLLERWPDISHTNPKPDASETP
ncbi:MAG: hypothetical protein L0Z52_11130, partial [Acidobacteria bacterium]|nr:hypothetical protein [Acidobacteriota bacterium]